MIIDNVACWCCSMYEYVVRNNRNNCNYVKPIFGLLLFVQLFAIRKIGFAIFAGYFLRTTQVTTKWNYHIAQIIGFRPCTYHSYIRYISTSLKNISIFTTIMFQRVKTETFILCCKHLLSDKKCFIKLTYELASVI